MADAPIPPSTLPPQERPREGVSDSEQLTGGEGGWSDARQKIN